MRGEKAAEASVKRGGEPDLNRGRYFMQAIPATLAKMGFVVFQGTIWSAWPIAQLFRTARDSTMRSGRTPTAKALPLRGLQTWNSDSVFSTSCFLFLMLDPKRVGMTGASGGGTPLRRSFSRRSTTDSLARFSPAVMVFNGNARWVQSAENCSLLRINTGNVSRSQVSLRLQTDGSERCQRLDQGDYDQRLPGTRGALWPLWCQG